LLFVSNINEFAAVLVRCNVVKLFADDLQMYAENEDYFWCWYVLKPNNQTPINMPSTVMWSECDTLWTNWHATCS